MNKESRQHFISTLTPSQLRDFDNLANVEPKTPEEKALMERVLEHNRQVRISWKNFIKDFYNKRISR